MCSSCNGCLFRVQWNALANSLLKDPKHQPRRDLAMKHVSSICVAALLISGVAHAQSPAAKDRPGNNAVNSEQKNSNAPVAGRNSFTEGQAKSAIEKAGYTNVTELKK